MKILDGDCEGEKRDMRENYLRVYWGKKEEKSCVWFWRIEEKDEG